jgi:L-lactate permease
MFMWTWIAFLGVTSILLLWMSRAQPFPEIGGRWAWTMLGLTGILTIAMYSPHEMNNPNLPPLVAGAIGGLGVMIGAMHDRRKRDVILSPFAGMWFTAATVSILSEGWSSYSNSEQWVGFILATIVILLEIFLFWKGLVIGIQGISWSQAALRQLDRGLIDGDRGAISMFEKSWSVDDSWLDAMSHAALIRIHEYKGNITAVAKHSKLLEQHGGEEIVDSAWIEKIDSCIKRLSAPIIESE